jgi:hypothetical protein
MARTLHVLQAIGPYISSMINAGGVNLCQTQQPTKLTLLMN